MIFHSAKNLKIICIWVHCLFVGSKINKIKIYNLSRLKYFIGFIHCTRHFLSKNIICARANNVILEIKMAFVFQIKAFDANLIFFVGEIG